MAVQAGFPPRYYHFVGRGSVAVRAEYLRAVRGGYLRNYVPLARFFEAAIRRREINLGLR